MNSRRLRLCVVTPAHWDAFMGGAQYQLKCLVETLMPLGHYDIFYLARRVPPHGRAQGYQIVRIGKTGRIPRWGYIADAIPLYRALREIGPDVIYQRVGCAYGGIAALYASRHRVRYLWHVSSDSDVLPQSLRAVRNPLVRRAEKWGVEYGIRHATCIVTQTEYQACSLQAHYGRIADAVIPNFHPYPTECVDKSGPLTVVWVANFKPMKQPEAFVRLAAQMGDLAAVRFVMVGAPASGSGDQEWNASVMRSINATPNLTYLGPQSQSQVNELLARAHLFVNTSRWEGFANTFIQAWMREVPVVSLEVDPDGILEREAIGVRAGCEKVLEAAAREFIANPARRIDYATRARSYAMSKHSLDNVAALTRLIDCGTL